MGLVINVEIESILGNQDALITENRLYQSVIDGFRPFDLSVVSGDVWETWAFNGLTFEPSVYSGFEFNSFAVDDGVTYGVKEEGIYVLDGADDAGDEIHSGVILSADYFGNLNRKRFRQVFFDITGTTPLIRGEADTVGLSIPIINSKVTFPRTLTGNYWTFLVADFDTLNRMELFHVILPR